MPNPIAEYLFLAALFVPTAGILLGVVYLLVPRRASHAQVEAQFVYRLQTLGGFGGKADQLNAYSVFLNDPGYFERDLARYEQVTREHLHRAANKYLSRDTRLALSVVPKGKRDQASKSSESEAVSLLRTEAAGGGK